MDSNDNGVSPEIIYEGEAHESHEGSIGCPGNCSGIISQAHHHGDFNRENSKSKEHKQLGGRNINKIK